MKNIQIYRINSKFKNSGFYLNWVLLRDKPYTTTMLTNKLYTYEKN